MLRNIVLAVSSLAVLIILFVGYSALVGGPARDAGRHSPVETLPPQTEPVAEPLRVGQALELPPGGKILLRRYDQRTGRPRDMFLCRDWQPVAGSKNEIRLSEPELAMVLPSGMIVTICAAEGQIAVDRIEQSQMQPKMGWLAGNVRIVLDRQTSPTRTPSTDRPEDLITVSVDRLEFDLEAGELKTADRVTVVAEDFEIAGTGLHLVWNQADNRIETLTIDRGEQFVLYAAAGLFGMVEQPQPSASLSEAMTPAASAPAGQPQRQRPPSKATAYRCVLDGGLTAEQYRGSEPVGRLEAEVVELLFDVGGGAERFLRGDRSDGGSSTRPAGQQRDRLVLHWSGRLHLEPTAVDAKATENRRRFAAFGSPVAMSRGDVRVRCGKVAFHDDTQRIWLYPTVTGTVELEMGSGRSVTARSVYVDQAVRVIKLVGPLELVSHRQAAAQQAASAIRCAGWAELRMAGADPAARPAAADPLAQAEHLESATFVGDVQVDLGEQALTAHQLQLTFRPGAADHPLEELFDAARAWGQVRLTSGDGQVTCHDLSLVFDRTWDRELYPRRMEAVGSVVLTRATGRQSLRSLRYLLSRMGLASPEPAAARITGDRVAADLAPPPSDRAAEGPRLLLLTLDVFGQAELRDPENEVVARGDYIGAVFEGLNRLSSATVRGRNERPGLLYSRPYTIGGRQIHLDRTAQTVQVDGPSRLKFKSRRSLQGERRSEPTTIAVSCTGGLRIDGRGNQVGFEGDVWARSGQEGLRSDRLTLVLADAEEPSAPASASLWRSLWRPLRRLVAGRRVKRDELFAFRRDQDVRLRKEPVFLRAENALVTSDTYEPGSDTPIVEASIRAPLLEMDIVSRQIVTSGLTQLVYLDRRGPFADQPDPTALGLPSALLSRGPSQTAMQCERRMVYKLGEEGPDRQDTAVFEGGVVFVHRAGKEMVHLEQMLPQLSELPELLDDLHSRNVSLDCDRLECWFAVDDSAAGRHRGGALTRRPLRLALLTAMGGVYLRDVEGPRIREVSAAWAEFSREHGRIEVRGSEAADARIYFENTQTGRFDVHAGRELTIHLEDGTIRSDRIAGEMRR